MGTKKYTYVLTFIYKKKSKYDSIKYVLILQKWQDNIMSFMYSFFLKLNY